MQRRIRDIAEGQRFQKLGSGGGFWEVVAVRTDMVGATHARMRSLTEPYTFRTLAVEVILDPHNFLPIEPGTGLRH